MDESLKTNILTMACSGIAIAALGFLIYFFRKSADAYLPFILAVPPIGVAAYVFVFNLLSKLGPEKADVANTPLKDLFLGSFFTGLVFFLFSFGLFISVTLIKRYL
mgnify:CR=1 FL=1